MPDLISPKIKNPEELAQITAGLKNQGKKIVHCHGVFELIHPGHIYHFEEAKKHGDVLIVSITDDKFIINKGPDRPVFPALVRAKSLAVLEIIDYVVIDYNPMPIELLKKIKPDIYFKGQEFEPDLQKPETRVYKEAQTVKSLGGEIKFTHKPVFSSSRFLKDHLELYPKETRIFLNDFTSRHSFKEIKDSLKSLRHMKVLVIGETIIDEYNYCRAMGKIPKDNLIATRFLNKEVFAGGVLACANHLAGFCYDVHLVSALGGSSSYQDFVKDNLNPNITFRFFRDDKGRTIVKKRFIDFTFFTKMFEIYHFDDRHLPEDVSRQIVDYLSDVLDKYDLVLAADYGHGFFDKNIIAVLTQKANFLAVNTQINSANLGFNLITKYPRIDYACISEPEARLAVCQKDSDISEVVSEIFKTADIKKLSITQGHLGSVSCQNPDEIYKTPVLSLKVSDRMGAADAFLSVASPCAAKGLAMDVVGFIGNVAGAIHVTIIGNKSSVSPEQVNNFIQTLFK